jgi:hypothetical protein
VDASVAQLAALPPVFSLSNQQLIVSQFTSNPRPLRIYGTEPMRLVAGWIKANYRADIATMADDAFGKPTSVALMTHTTNIVMSEKAMWL